MIVFAGGIDVGYSNHVESCRLSGEFSIHPIFRVISTSRCGSIIIASLRPDSHLSSAIGEDRAVIAVSVISMVTLARHSLPVPNDPIDGRRHGYRRSSRCLERVDGPAAVSKRTTFAGSADVNPPNWPTPWSSFAITAWLAGRHRLTAFLAGMALFFHLQVGAIAAIALAPLHRSDSCARREGNPVVPRLYPAASFLYGTFMKWRSEV
jgi:hypothetical protein